MSLGGDDFIGKGLWYGVSEGVGELREDWKWPKNALVALAEECYKRSVTGAVCTG
jgi:hypothetical protein